MVKRAGSTGLDPFLSKESLRVLSKMGFGKTEPRLGPLRYHGIAARTRLAVAGKVSHAWATLTEHFADAVYGWFSLRRLPIMRYYSRTSMRARRHVMICAQWLPSHAQYFTPAI